MTKKREELKQRRTEVENASPIFNKIREHFGGSNIFTPGSINRFGLERKDNFLKNYNA